MAESDIEILRLFRRLALTGRGSASQPVSLPQPVVIQMMKMAFRDELDESWYLTQNPDVAEAIEKKSVKSALDHFVASGIFEGRLPRAYPLDEQDYGQRHRDVAQSIEAGRVGSASEHFFRIGFIEGREFNLLA